MHQVKPKSKTALRNVAIYVMALPNLQLKPRSGLIELQPKVRKICLNITKHLYSNKLVGDYVTI